TRTDLTGRRFGGQDGHRVADPHRPALDHAQHLSEPAGGLALQLALDVLEAVAAGAALVHLQHRPLAQPQPRPRRPPLHLHAPAASPSPSRPRTTICSPIWPGPVWNPSAARTASVSAAIRLTLRFSDLPLRSPAMPRPASSSASASGSRA